MHGAWHLEGEPKLYQVATVQENFGYWVGTDPKELSNLHLEALERFKLQATPFVSVNTRREQGIGFSKLYQATNRDRRMQCA
jgi:hypothetical protein